MKPPPSFSFTAFARCGNSKAPPRGLCHAEGLHFEADDAITDIPAGRIMREMAVGRLGLPSFSGLEWYFRLILSRTRASIAL